MYIHNHNNNKKILLENKEGNGCRDEQKNEKKYEGSKGKDSKACETSDDIEMRVIKSTLRLQDK